MYRACHKKALHVTKLGSFILFSDVTKMASSLSSMRRVKISLFHVRMQGHESVVTWPRTPIESRFFYIRECGRVLKVSERSVASVIVRLNIRLLNMYIVFIRFVCMWFTSGRLRSVATQCGTRVPTFLRSLLFCFKGCRNILHRRRRHQVSPILLYMYLKQCAMIFHIVVNYVFVSVIKDTLS